MMPVDGTAARDLWQLFDLLDDPAPAVAIAAAVAAVELAEFRRQRLADGEGGPGDPVLAREVRRRLDEVRRTSEEEES